MTNSPVRQHISMVLAAAFILLAVTSCNKSGSYTSDSAKGSHERIVQEEDGTLSLSLADASFYNNESDPSNNTAEWNILISKPGRYSVWLSSATTDTMNLEYVNSVKINLFDERLEARPVGDRIVLNASEVKSPWYRADSYMGTFYIDEAGEYNVQIINEKVIPVNVKTIRQEEELRTRIMSVILTPMTR